MQVIRYGGLSTNYLRDHPELDLSWRDATGRTVMHHAALAGYGVLVRDLAARGAQVDPRDEDGRTPLHLTAVQEWHNWAPHALRRLLEAGADPCAADAKGNTSLHLLLSRKTIYHAELEAVDLLLEAGADGGAADPAGRTPLHLVAAAEGPYVCTIAAMLLARDPPLDARDSDGRTPLQLALLHDSCWVPLLQATPSAALQAQLDDLLETINSSDWWETKKKQLARLLTIYAQRK